MDAELHDQLPPGGLALDGERLYRPPRPSLQLLALASCLVACPALANGIAWLIGDLSSEATTLVFFALGLVLALGYALWLGLRLATGVLGLARLLLGLPWRWLTRRAAGARSAPERSDERWLRFCLATQKQGRCFLGLSLAIGLPLGLVATAFESEAEASALFAAAAGGSAAWGSALAWLARHGWLPPPEPPE